MTEAIREKMLWLQKCVRKFAVFRPSEKRVMNMSERTGCCDATRYNKHSNTIMHPLKKTNVPVYNVCFDLSSVDSLKELMHHVKNASILMHWMGLL